MNEHIQAYYKAVCEAYQLGNIETSYYKPIIALLTPFGCTVRDLSGERSGEIGENVDLKIWRSNEEITETEPFAAIEAKKVEGIDKRAVNQVKTSAARYGNLILTDNLVWEFWHANEDKMYAGVRLIEKTGDKLELREDNIELFISLVEDFMLKDPIQIRSSSKLAEYMAIHAKTIRSIIAGILKDDGAGQPLIDDRQKKLPMFSELYGLYKKIKTELRPLLTSGDFADMYAQTIVYGLFIARHNNGLNNAFNRYKAIESLREESPLLNRFFSHIASAGKTHPTLEAVIDKLCLLYQTCDISELLGQDPNRDIIVHFYEDFLTKYDPELRKSLGVFYTPSQVVKYLISMIDKSLIEDFGIIGGLSNNEQLQVIVPSHQREEKVKHGRGYKTVYRDTKEITAPRVAVLDPACGTGTFHAEIIKYIKNTYFSGIRKAFYPDYIKDEKGLLSRLIGFEIMMTGYVVSHLKIRRAIVETLGYVPENHLPANVYLTNTLTDPGDTLEQGEQMTLFDFSAAITDEAYKAATWKTRRPIKVIAGNPPYLAASITPYDISAYKFETDGKTKLKEKTLNSLNDDYVKFFRFAEKIINKYGEGILAFVSNNGYLDNPTFRGMRASLLRTFDKIYIVDLHGSAVKQEKTPDGGKDENIFDIMQGVSLFIGIKITTDNSWAKVFHADLWGTRDHKFNSMAHKIKYNELKPDFKMAYFKPYKSDEIYDSGINLRELFNITSICGESGNDRMAIQKERTSLEKIVNDFRTLQLEELKLKYNLYKEPSSWKLKNIINDLTQYDGKIRQIAYRPFDIRWTYYSGRPQAFFIVPCVIFRKA